MMRFLALPVFLLWSAAAWASEAVSFAPAPVGRPGAQAPAPPRRHEIKSTHFILALQSGSASSRAILEKAESDYDKILRLLGFSGLSSFWLWEKRCRIYLYSTQSEFIRGTGRPAWSSGFARIGSREIVSYEGAPDFLDGILPHEMTHLILRDFVGPENTGIPLWLEEGLAMFQEKNPREEFGRFLSGLGDKRIPIGELCAIRSLGGLGRERAAAFYAQSRDAVCFLIETCGAERFAALCRNLRDGMKLDAALKRLDPSRFPTIEAFEKQWIAARDSRSSSS